MKMILVERIIVKSSEELRKIVNAEMDKIKDKNDEDIIDALALTILNAITDNTYQLEK